MALNEREKGRGRRRKKRQNSGQSYISIGREEKKSGSNLASWCGGEKRKKEESERLIEEKGACGSPVMVRRVDSRRRKVGKWRSLKQEKRGRNIRKVCCNYAKKRS